MSFRQGFALVTKYKWQLVYLAGRTVRCLASMYDKPFQKILCFYHSGNVTHARKYIVMYNMVDSTIEQTMEKNIWGPISMIP